MNKDDYFMTKTPGALYPISNISNQNLEPYKKYLDKAVSDKEILNIAVSAPYGGGKTSILLSYFKNNYQKNKYQFITLPDFFKTEDNSTEELQERIIEQLLFSSEPKDLPYSKINRIKDNTYLEDMLEFSGVFLVMTFIILFINHSRNSFNTVDFSNIINYLFLALFIILGVQFYRAIKVKISNSTVDLKSNLINISTTENNEESLKTFTRYSEELMYYFRVSDTEYVIFEDLDRFDNPKIFQDLRELNENINKQNLNKKITFIYSLRDSVFEYAVEESYSPLFSASEKAKFFDYIIPVFPNTDFYNSRRQFKNEIIYHNAQFYKSFVKDSTKFNNLISDIGFYVKDLRIIKLITHEFFVYKSKIELNTEERDTSIEYYKLFAMIIYKNFNHEDYEKISTGKSDLNLIFNSLNIMLQDINNNEYEENDKKIENLQSEKESLYDFVNYDIEEILKNQFQMRLNSFQNASGFKVNNIIYELNDYKDFYQEIIKSKYVNTNIEIMSNYRRNNQVASATQFLETMDSYRDLRTLIKALDNKHNVPSTRINEINQEIIELESKNGKLKYNQNKLSSGTIINKFMLIDNPIYNELAKSPDEKEKFYHFADVKLLNKLNSLNEPSLMLLINDYISDDFIQYVSLVEYSSNESDADFIRKVLRRFEFTEDQSLVNPVQVLKTFEDREVLKSYLYASQILVLDIDSTLREVIISKVVNNKDYEFVFNLYSYTTVGDETKKDVFKYLILSQPDFLKKFTIKYIDNVTFMLNAFDNDKINSLIKSSPNIIEAIESIFSSIQDAKNIYNIYYLMQKVKNIDVVLFIRGVKLTSNIEEFINSNKKLIKNERELLEFILRYDLFNNEMDYKYFKEFFNLKSYFEGLLNKFYELKIRVFDLEKFIIFILSEYKKGMNESYQSYNLFLDYALELITIDSTDLLKWISEKINNIDIIETYKDVNFVNYSSKHISEILIKIEFNKILKEEKINRTDLLNLIKSKKVNFTLERLKIMIDMYKEDTEIINEFLAHGYAYETSLLFEVIKENHKLLNINSKIYLFYLFKSANEKSLILKSINNLFEEIDFDLLDIEVFNQMLNTEELNIAQLKGIMHYSDDKKIRSAGLKYLVKNKELPINSKELDIALNTSFFETATKNGSIAQKFEEGIEKEYIEILSKHGYASFNESNEDKLYIYRKFSERFPDPLKDK